MSKAHYFQYAVISFLVNDGFKAGLVWRGWLELPQRPQWPDWQRWPQWPRSRKPWEILLDKILENNLCSGRAIKISARKSR